MNRLEELVDELDGYLPAAIKNQALQSNGGPTGPGTLKGFHAKVAEVFQLGRSIGGDEDNEAQRIAEVFAEARQDADDE